MAVLTGVSETNWLLLKTMHRAGLVYRCRGTIPDAKLEWRDPVAVTAADVRLCERLIAAFQRSRRGEDDASGTSGIWAHLVDSHHRALLRALEPGDPDALARLLVSMFRGDFMFGMAHGAWAAHVKSRLGSRIFTLKWLDSVMALAGALG